MKNVASLVVHQVEVWSFVLDELEKAAQALFVNELSVWSVPLNISQNIFNPTSVSLSNCKFELPGKV